MTQTSRKSAHCGVSIAVFSMMAIIGATSKDLADKLHAPAWLVVTCAAIGGLGAVAAGLITYRKAAWLDTETQREVVATLITFLEDRRLLTEDAGYQSHFPDHLRQSAEEIRRRTSDALQRISRRSDLVPALKQIQMGARSFQEASEGAVNGTFSSKPETPMGLQQYLGACVRYRGDIAAGIQQLTEISQLKLDPAFEEAMREAVDTGQRQRAWEARRRDNAE